MTHLSWKRDPLIVHLTNRPNFSPAFCCVLIAYDCCVWKIALAKGLLSHNLRGPSRSKTITNRPRLNRWAEKTLRILDPSLNMFWCSRHDPGSSFRWPTTKQKTVRNKFMSKQWKYFPPFSTTNLNANIVRALRLWQDGGKYESTAQMSGCRGESTTITRNIRMGPKRVDLKALVRSVQKRAYCFITLQWKARDDLTVGVNVEWCSPYASWDNLHTTFYCTTPPRITAWICWILEPTSVSRNW